MKKKIAWLARSLLHGNMWHLLEPRAYSTADHCLMEGRAGGPDSHRPACVAGVAIPTITYGLALRLALALGDGAKVGVDVGLSL